LAPGTAGDHTFISHPCSSFLNLLSLRKRKREVGTSTGKGQREGAEKCQKFRNRLERFGVSSRKKLSTHGVAKLWDAFNDL
jgi:hypothetical protein